MGRSERLSWEEVGSGFVTDGWEIHLDAPRRWQLIEDGRVISWHPTASDAKKAAAEASVRRWLGRRVLRSTFSFAGAVVALLVLADLHQGWQSGRPIPVWFIPTVIAFVTVSVWSFVSLTLVGLRLWGRTPIRR